MNFFDFKKLNSIDLIKKHIEKIETNLLLNVDYPFINKVDKVLEYFKENNEQLKIIKKKIREARGVEFFYDVIAELLIIYQYLYDNAEFINEGKNETPDIKTDKYLVEVKRIRLSDGQISILDKITAKKNLVISSTSVLKEIKKNDEIEPLNKKIEEKITKAIQQIGNKEGIIYVIYSLDLSGHYQDLDSRKKIFKCYCLDYFNLKQIKNIKLFVSDLNDLIQY